MDYLMDFMYLVDIMLNLRTTFKNKNGEEVTNPKEITRSYILNPRFIIDIVSIT
jgi:hypothetical protein